jgi:hypothetical protein
LRAADEAVVNKVINKFKKLKNPPFKISMERNEHRILQDAAWPNV